MAGRAGARSVLPALLLAVSPWVTDSAAAWELEGSLYGYYIPADSDYYQPTLTADRDRLHLEARYNYESKDTASVWAGYNFSSEKGATVEWGITPMLGVVVGDVEGIAPGYRAWLTWQMLEVTSEGEYFFDAEESSDNYFFNWSEISLAPLDWFRFGIAIQRTRAYETDVDVQRGLLAGVNGEQWSITGYLFNLDETDTTVVIGATYAF